MKTAQHILLKDLRKFWPVILVSVGVHIFGYCLALSNLDATRVLSGMGPALTKVLQQAPLVRWGLVFLLSVWVMLEDRAVGDRIAWLTRPIFARDMLVAKFSFLALAVALPAGLVGIGVAVWMQAPLTDALAAGASNVLLTFFGATLFAAIAGICATMNQAVLLTAGIFSGVALLSFGLFQWAHLSLPARADPISNRTAFILTVGMTGLSAFATVGHQYNTRRTLRTVLVAGVLSLLTFVALHWWPLTLWPDAKALASATPTPASMLKLVPGNAPADFRTTERAFGASEASILVPLRLEGNPPDRSFGVRRVTSTLTTDQGVTISTVHEYNSPRLEDDLAAAAALGFTTPAHAPLRYAAAVECSLDQFRQLQGQVGALKATVTLAETRYETIARLPVRAGAELTADGQLSRIFSTQFINGSCEIGFQFAHIDPILGTRHPAWPNHFVLVNLKRGEYSEAHGVNQSGTGGPEMSFVTSRNRFLETRSVRTSELSGKVDPAWLADAEFCFLVGQEVKGGPIALSFTIDRLTVPTTQITHRVIVINPDGTREEFER